MGLEEKTILKHEDFFARSVNIGITSDAIVDKINAFDWLDLTEAKNEIEYSKVLLSIFERFNFKYPKKYDSIVKKAFTVLFVEAVENVKEAIVAVSKSYNIEGGATGFRNEAVDKFYYIEYWATKKNLPVNYNEKNIEKRNLFNFDTIILSILADKLRTFNEYEINKPKK